LVLTSVFIGGVTDGHGHHQVAGQMNQEVFEAAADPKVFPEMGLPPWAPLKVYARVPFARITDQGMFDYATGKFSPPRFTNYVTGVVSTTEPQATVTIHEGDKPSIPAFNGMSYVQWARQGLALQKSQIGTGFRIPPAGTFDVGYTLMGSRLHCKSTASGAPCLDSETWASAKPTALPSKPQSPEDQDLFTGIDTTFPGLAQLAPSAPKKLWAVLTVIDNQLAEAQKLYDPTHIELTAPPLREALKLLDNLLKDVEPSPLPQTEKFNLLHELRIKRVQLNNALNLALNVSAVLIPSEGGQVEAVPGKPLTVQAELAALSAPELALQGAFLEVETVGSKSTLPAVTKGPSRNDKEVNLEWHVLLPAEADITRPYFGRINSEEAIYRLDPTDPRRNAPATPAPLTVLLKFEDAGVPIELRRIVAAASTSKALPQEQVSIVPRLAISLSPAIAVDSTSEKRLMPIETTITVQSNVPGTQGSVGYHYPGDWKVSIGKPDFSFSNSEQPSHIAASVLPVGLVSSKSPFDDLHVRFIADENPRPKRDIGFDKGYRSVGYPGIPHTNLYRLADLRVVGVDVTTAPQLHIAYLPGTGDEVPQFLPSLGITPTILKPSDLTLANLKQYDAILLGVRAYAAHPELSGSGSDPLNAYAKQGGIVIAQYNTSFNPASAPFPYSLPGDSAHNVVEEDQPVHILAPESPLLTWPNRITPADFNSWVEERGHGFASDWSPEYQPLLEMHDPDQDPQKGGLLLAKVGKGAYIYCALALYRQLPEGVPGAYRLIANLLSYAKNPHR